ncbi:hypothetical protein PybrP1_004444 [[Pythium] brassicae (nom. inval.)]|nr:hypothetical protein PybrP1_004444 [[Pythium] brassicae (nom. inval.)]
MSNFCEIVQIAEVLATPALQQNRSVRVTGRLEAFDAGRALAQLSFQGAALTVDTRVLATDGLALRVGSMYQFLGETHVTHSTPGASDVRLVARVARNVDSLDVNLFLEALALRRQFLASSS